MKSYNEKWSWILDNEEITSESKHIFLATSIDIDIDIALKASQVIACLSKTEDQFRL